MKHKKIILLIVGVIYILPIYTMNSNLDKNSKKLLTVSFYETESNIDLLKTMLANKVDPNICNYHESTPLHFAALSKDSAYASIYVSILLSAGANPNKQNLYNSSPLVYAALQRQSKSIQVLLAAKANPNLADNNKETPLHFAINSHPMNTQIVQLLLSASANPNTKNSLGNSPLHELMIQEPVPELLKIVHLLLQRGADVNVFNNQPHAPLQLLAHTYGKMSWPPVSLSILRKMGRLLVWHHYILLPHFTKAVPKEIACIIASHAAFVCTEQPTIWS